MTLTPKATELQALLKRVEAARGPNRELFLAIAESVVPDYRQEMEWRAAFNSFIGVGAWTDAALALAERVLPEANHLGVEKDLAGWNAYVSRNAIESGHWLFEAWGKKTPALALVAATLRAMIATQGEKT